MSRRMECRMQNAGSIYILSIRTKWYRKTDTFHRYY